jgi:hypothetical protein
MALTETDPQQGRRAIEALRARYAPEVAQFMEKLVLHTGKNHDLTFDGWYVDGWDTRCEYPENQETVEEAKRNLEEDDPQIPQILYHNGEIWHLTPFGELVYKELKKERS